MLSELNLTPEDELILHCSCTTMDTNTEDRVKELINNGINWDQVLHKASIHGLKPLLYFNLKNNQDQIPLDMSILNEHFLDNGRKNLLFWGELLRVIKVFEDKDIVAVPYKGPVMAMYTYGNLALREFGDIDIYVNKSEIGNVKKLLMEEGYEPELKLDASKEAYYLKSQRELKFIKDDIKIEIHWNVSGVSFSFPQETFFPINPDYIKTITVNNQKIKSFSNEDLVLILSLHVAGHLWSRLSWLCDISELIRSTDYLNWRFIVNKAKYLAIERILYLNLSLLHDLFDLELSNDIQKYIQEDPVIEALKKQVFDLIYDSKNFNFQRKVFLRYKMREYKMNGIKDVYRILTIPQSREWNSLVQKGPFSLLYLLKRPLQIFGRLKE